MHFGDRVESLGALRSDDGLRLVIRQPAIAGQPATEQQISEFFVGSGWLPFRVEGELAFYDPRHQLVISDTHPGNLVLMDDGLLAPIDLRVQQLTESLVDAVRALCAPTDA